MMPLLPELESLFGLGSTDMSSLKGLKSRLDGVSPYRFQRPPLFVAVLAMATIYPLSSFPFPVDIPPLKTILYPYVHRNTEGARGKLPQGSAPLLCVAFL